MRNAIIEYHNWYCTTTITSATLPVWISMFSLNIPGPKHTKITVESVGHRSLRPKKSACNMARMIKIGPYYGTFTSTECSLGGVLLYIVRSKSILQTDFFFSQNKAPLWDYRLDYKPCLPMYICLLVDGPFVANNLLLGSIRYFCMLYQVEKDTQFNICFFECTVLTIYITFFPFFNSDRRSFFFKTDKCEVFFMILFPQADRGEQQIMQC